MLKKSIVFILMLTLSASIITACGNSNSTTDNGSIASNLTNNNSTSGNDTANAVSESTAGSSPSISGKPVISVTAPEGWEKNESAVVPTYRNSTCTFIVTSDYMPLDSSTLKKYVDYAKEKLKEVFPDAVFKDPEKTTAAGMEAMKLEYSSKVSGIDFDSIITYIFKDGYANTFTFSGLSSEFADKKGDLEKFLNSVKFE